MHLTDILADPAELEKAVTGTSRPSAERTSRRTAGQVFTPPGLARLVCKAVLEALPRSRSRLLRVLDPACGDGSFLEAAAEVLGRRRAQLMGIERDPALARACRARVPEAEVHVAEALFGMPEEVSGGDGGVDGGVDAVIGNPPYVRSIRLRDSDPEMWARVRGAYAATAHGEWDLYGAFIEASLGWVRPGGQIGLIVPSRWLTARWAARLRRQLAARAAIRGVVDFGAAQVFPDATTYCSILLMSRRGPLPLSLPFHDPVPALRRTGPATWENGQIDVEQSVWVVEPRSQKGKGKGTGKGKGKGQTLGDVARIAKGTGTNADGVFVLERCTVRGDLVHGTDGYGAGITVELAATRACWRGRDIQLGAASATRCIVPYTDDGELIPFDAFRRRWPRAAAHLTAHRAHLEARERGRFAGDAFHVFGRPQNLAFLLDPAPKVIVPDVARTPRAVLDTSGALVLDTAYALRPLPGAPEAWRDPRALLALCASPQILAWLARAGVPLRGDYRRLKTAFLAPMPLPARPPATSGC